MQTPQKGPLCSVEGKDEDASIPSEKPISPSTEQKTVDETGSELESKTMADGDEQE